ncbi:transposase [Bradyrhizobium sp. CIR3A]|uniref:transposase n=1 Tax=Bradyrhizobium sp. CIR3A TaxID=2663838 RepID=UPI001605916B|nr:transposase [Bradyrhizobium sp. CIR3A]
MFWQRGPEDERFGPSRDARSRRQGAVDPPPSLEPGAIVTDVARRHGCRPQQVHDWRRRARLGQLVLPASADTLSFVPVVSESALPAAAEPTGSPEAAVVTVELLGARVEVRGTSGLAVLSDVFLALRRIRSC